MATGTNELPQIDVSSLGSFVFCQRAGVLAFLQQGLGDDDNEDEPRIPNLGYLPEFSVDELQTRKREVWNELRWYGLAALVWLLIVGLLAKYGSLTLAILLFVAFLPLGYKTFSDLLTLNSILSELGRYKHMPKTPLDPAATEPIEITWWGLVKTGYRPIKPGAALHDGELALAGKPWRMLGHNDGERLPVIEYRGEQLTLRDSHKIKLAAYSHLIITKQHATSDWGIVLDANTKRGFAIRISFADRTEMLNRLEQFRKVLANDHRGKPLKIPVAAPCENCRYGQPRPYVRGASETRFRAGAIGASVADGKNHMPVHSDCGDKYEWRPLHRYWQRSPAAD